MTKTITKLMMLMIVLLSLTSVTQAVEIRGTVTDTSFTWTPQNFAAFYYDIDNDVASDTETMSAIVSGKSIPTDGLIYSTEKALVSKTNHPTYYVLGWMGEKWVAVGGKANKIAKLVLDMKDDDKNTLISGQTLTLGNDYTLKVNSVDARATPRQAWVTLSKGDIKLDDGVVQMGQRYNYTTTVLGDSDVLVFSIYIDAIFSGAESDMIQMKYGWLIDTSTAKEIKVSDKYGSMEVTMASSDRIELKNKNSISLSKDSEVSVMGNIKFKTANSNLLRYYPKIDVTGDVSGIVSTPIVSVVATPKVTPSNQSVLCTPTEKIVEKIVTVTVTVTPDVTEKLSETPTPVQTKKSPGFNGIVGVIGLIAVAFIVRRQNKKKE